MTADIIDQLINQYTGSITNIQSGSIALGRELFNAIAVISVAVLGLNHLLRRKVDMVEANLELIRWLIYLDFFYAFITNFSSIYSFVYFSIQQIANYLGAKAAGNPVDISPSNIFHIGMDMSWQMLSKNITFNLFRDFLIVIISVIAAAVVLYCFAAIGLELILVQIGSQIILSGGIFLLAFSGFQWTRDYAERYVHTFFHIGIKIIFIYILVGIGIGLTDTWRQTLAHLSGYNFVSQYMLIGLSSFIYYKLCVKIPDQAVSWLTGRLAMGFETATSVNAAIKAPAKIAKTTVALAAGAEGITKAVGAASQFAKTKLESQGKKETPLNLGWETIKTLGTANRAVKQEAWDRKVNDTRGGKMAKNILDKMPKTDSKSDPKTVSDNGAMDYSI